MVARETREIDPLEARKYVEDALLPTLLPALAELARSRPEDPRTWLAQQLLTTKPSKPVYALTVEVVLVLGLEVSGASALCEELCTAVASEGRACVHIALSALMKAEIASGSAFGSELSVTIQQGKMIPKASQARLVSEALTDAEPGIYLLEGYPTSLQTLQNMGEEIGIEPSRALLLDLAEAAATAKFESAGTQPPAALQKMKSFSMHTRGMVGELEARGKLVRLDAALPSEEVLAKAKAVLLR